MYVSWEIIEVVSWAVFVIVLIWLLLKRKTNTAILDMIIGALVGLIAVAGLFVITAVQASSIEDILDIFPPLVFVTVATGVLGGLAAHRIDGLLKGLGWGLILTLAITIPTPFLSMRYASWRFGSGTEASMIGSLVLMITSLFLSTILGVSVGLSIGIIRSLHHLLKRAVTNEG
ncbi:MAG: hypothetical protein KJ069_05830 [Anaerolineae bacterium]|nr:hypothetical protein [Anaerolineae bacterium]